MRWGLLRILTAVGVFVLLAPACGSADPRAARNTTAEATATPIPNVSPTPMQVATPVVEATPTNVAEITMGVTIVGFRDLLGLTWDSVSIVHGKVSQVLPAQRFPAVNGPLGTKTPRSFSDTQIYTDYIIDVDRVFRGTPTKTVTLRQMGGQVDDVRLVTQESAPLTVGDDLVLFLTPPTNPQPGNALWATGSSQGLWLRHGDEFAAYPGEFPSLSLAGIAQCVANALQQGPPENLPLPLIPLAQSPPGPDLPVPATAIP